MPNQLDTAGLTTDLTAIFEDLSGQTAAEAAAALAAAINANLEDEPGGGTGVTNHLDLVFTTWEDDGHLGGAGTLAGFDLSGEAEEVVIGSGLVNGGGTLSVDFGTGAGEVCEGDDSRLSDDRDPTAHASSHLSAGSDPVLATTRTASRGPQLGATGLLDLSFLAAWALFAPRTYTYNNNSATNQGFGTVSALGGTGTSGGLFRRATGATGCGVRCITRTTFSSSGILVAFRFRVPAGSLPDRLYCGLGSANESASDTAPADYIGWLRSVGRGDSGPRPCSRSSTTGTQTDGTAVTDLVEDHWNFAVIYWPRGGSTVYLELHDLTAGTVSSSSVTADLPASSAGLGFALSSWNAAGSVSLDVSHVLQWDDLA